MGVQPHQTASIGHGKDYLTIFGDSILGMADIMIVNDCDKNNSVTHLGETFALPNASISKESPQADEYLAGSKEFIVMEIEVY